MKSMRKFNFYIKDVYASMATDNYFLRIVKANFFLIK